MPYMMVSRGNMVCVHRQNEDKTPGEKKHCYSDGTKADNLRRAKKYMAALYAAEDKNLTAEEIIALVDLAADESLDHRVMLVRDSFMKSYGPSGMDVPAAPAGCFLREVYDGYVIVSEGDSLYKVTYSLDDNGEPVFQDKADWAEVQQEYVEMGALDEPLELADDSGYGGYLVTDKDGKKHLPTRKNGKLDHGLMGAAWAALHGGYRGNKYQGPGKTEAIAKLKALYKQEGMTPPSEQEQVVEATDFAFNELMSDQGSVDLEYLKAIDGLAAGTFTAMNGMEVTFKPGDLQEYVDNTKAIIESTLTESGQVVGLPIDLEDHDHKGGAGWLIDLEVDKARNIIRFFINWTEAGLEVVRKNMRRFFSPSTDPEHKVILGGSLTNQPGTRNGKGQILLRPIELSQNLKGIDMTPTLEELAKLVNDLTTSVGALAETVKGISATPRLSVDDAMPDLEGVSPEIRELLNTPAALDRMGEIATKQAERMIHDENRKKHVVEFASKFVGGTPERPYGIHVRPGDLCAVLLSLDDTHMKAVENILQKTVEGVIDFAERGITGVSMIRRPRLEPKMAEYAREWLSSGKDIHSFFEANRELGNPEEYDLSEFIKEKAV